MCVCITVTSVRKRKRERRKEGEGKRGEGAGERDTWECHIHTYIIVGCCLATKVFIGNLPSAGWM